MRVSTLIIAFALALSLVSSGAAWSTDYEKGLDALLKGDYETALQEWEPLAEQEDAKAQYSLGNLYYFGNGVPRNYEMALKWFRPAAEQGLARAQYNLENLYLPYQGESCSIFDGPLFHCIDVPFSHSISASPFISRADDPQNHERSYEMALKWYRLAAEQGYANAQFVLGQLYSYGKGVPQDHEATTRWYHLAAEQGHAQALHHLGNNLAPGGVFLGFKWHALAEEHGFTEQCR